MKAIGYLQPKTIDQQDALMDIDLPMPQVSNRDLMVKVKAISVNPVDTKIRANVGSEDGQYKVLGWDAVGEVVAIGDQVELFNVGDEVWYAGDLTRQGSNAEYQLVDERITGLKPKSLSNAEAAAMPLTTITAWELLFDRLDFSPLFAGNDSQVAEKTSGMPKPRILIIGAAGGVGSILTQLAAKLTSATVIGTASRPESQAWVSDLGADHVIDHSKPLQPQLEAIGISDVSHVISLTHTDQHFDQLVEVLAPQGKLALIDDPQSNIDILKLKRKSLSLHWEFMYTRSMFNTWDMQKQHDLLSTMSQLIDDGVIKTTLGNHYGRINATNLKRAHEHLESHNAVGKIVLEGF
ncbi:zinc-binding alcohol dehydrogenase family protein [Endozoicomonas elysicola]|uniref:Zinc-type alcohol dehydrogenase-like protein n=1 Tax=Endozoicomonas elysicola TaxID=305900 RepID=A0A081KDB8_9GAMM|nr:zinc-binding alcohol dehydrogenase family protein [Endozoicomonas elysicola]KEI72144.1 NADPH:quinone reductase [Endozoicomonas elysicola]